MGDFLMGSGPEITFQQSPEQRQMYQMMQPTLSRMFGAAQAGQPMYNIPQAPSAMGRFTGVPMYDIPSAQGLMPGANWYSSIAPQVMQGIRAPYEYGSQQLMESFGPSLGSARGGMSGSAAAALGKYWAEADKNIGLQAWGMTQPALWADYQNQLTRNITGYQTALSEPQADYASAMQRWGMQNQQMMYPYQAATGLVGATYPQAVVEPGQQGLIPTMLGTAAQAAPMFGFGKLFGAFGNNRKTVSPYGYGV